MAVRRGRVDTEFRDQSIADLALLNITTDPGTGGFAWTNTLQLSDRHRLTVYDSAYLELAQRLDLPLATLDRDLRSAAHDLGISLLGARVK